MRRISRCLKGKVLGADDAASLIKSGMTIGTSGFTLTGYPKALPEALAASGHAKGLDIITGASVGDDMDGVMARAGIIAGRYSYQSNKDLRDEINSGRIGYADWHLSLTPAYISYGLVKKIDYAIIECAVVTEEGIIPTVSAGASQAILNAADRVILEVNEAVPTDIIGMHDFFDAGLPPNARPIPIIHPYDRVGTAYIPCDPAKIAAIVMTDRRDRPAKLKPVTEVSRRIGHNVVEFLKGEIKAGRLPADIGPIQSGVGSVANAVLYSLEESGFRGLQMYTETAQDSALELLDNGIFANISSSSLSLSASAQQRFYDNMDAYKKSVILRPQDITNHPEVIRRLGLVSLNTPIEVDIYGHVNSSHIMGSRIMNGIGGSCDFSRNARLNIFASESTAKNGAISCLVPMVSHVDHTEHDTQVIITEQGVADLRCKTPLERAELLIGNCAHPYFRPLLRDYLERAKKVSYGLHEPLDIGRAFGWHQRFMETGSMR